MILLPKAKAEAHYLLANLLPHLRSGSDIFLVGDNRGGINGADKLLAQYASHCQKLDSARRCSLIHCRARSAGQSVPARELVTAL